VQLADVFDRAQSTDTLTRAARQLLHQLSRHRGVEQLLLAAEVFVKVADRRVRPRRDVGHAGGREALLGEGAGGGGDEGGAHLGLTGLGHWG
jgi:hypothetical protein